MALTPNFTSRIIDSDASVNDLPAFHEALRAIEESDAGMLYPPIHTYKRIDLGGGAYFHAVDFINGWVLRFPNPGTYSVIGNLNCTISMTAGVAVERTKAAAFATTSVGGGGPTAAEIAAEMLDAAASGHNAAGTFGRYLAIAASVNGEMVVTGTPTTTSLQITSGSDCDDFYNDCTMIIASGTEVGMARIIVGYNATTKTLTFNEPLCEAPAPGDTIIIRTDHVHPTSQIADAVMAQAQVTPINANMVETNGEALIGDGTPGNRFRSHLVPVDG
jgi:hypothetical protein